MFATAGVAAGTREHPFALRDIAGQDPANGAAGREHARALYDFTEQHAGDLGFRKGDLLELVSRQEHEEWWVARLGGHEGKIPRSHVEPCAAPASSSIESGEPATAAGAAADSRR